jgi:hypothetical protein
MSSSVKWLFERFVEIGLESKMLRASAALPHAGVEQPNDEHCTKKQQNGPAAAPLLANLLVAHDAHPGKESERLVNISAGNVSERLVNIGSESVHRSLCPTSSSLILHFAFSGSLTTTTSVSKRTPTPNHHP